MAADDLTGDAADDAAADERPLTAAELTERLRSYDALLACTLTPLLRAQVASLAAASLRRGAAAERAASVAALLAAGAAAGGGVTETLVDLGGGYHCNARVAPDEPLLVDVGCGILLELPPRDALAYARIDAVRTAGEETRRAALVSRVAEDLAVACASVKALRRGGS